MSSAIDSTTLEPLDPTVTYEVVKRPTNAVITNLLAEAYGTSNQVIVPLTLASGRGIPVIVTRQDDSIGGTRRIHGKLVESPQTRVIVELGGVNRAELRLIATTV